MTAPSMVGNGGYCVFEGENRERYLEESRLNWAMRDAVEVKGSS